MKLFAGRGHTVDSEGKAGHTRRLYYKAGHGKAAFKRQRCTVAKAPSNAGAVCSTEMRASDPAVCGMKYGGYSICRDRQK